MSLGVWALSLMSQVPTGLDTEALPVQAQDGLQQSQYRVVTPLAASVARNRRRADKPTRGESMMNGFPIVDCVDCEGDGVFLPGSWRFGALAIPFKWRTAQHVWSAVKQESGNGTCLAHSMSYVNTSWDSPGYT